MKTFTIRFFNSILFLAFIISSCGGDDGAGMNNGTNFGPSVTDPIGNIDLTQGFGSTTIDISSVFTDPEGDELVYSVDLNTDDIVIVSVSGSTLIIDELDTGEAFVTINANDRRGGDACYSFFIRVGP